MIRKSSCVLLLTLSIVALAVFGTSPKVHAQAVETRTVDNPSEVPSPKVTTPAIEIAYDSGKPTFGFICGKDCMGAVRYNFASSTKLLSLRYMISNPTTVKLLVLDSRKTVIFEKTLKPDLGNSTSTQWFDYDISQDNVFVQGTFFVGYMWVEASEQGKGWLYLDEDSDWHEQTHIGTVSNLSPVRDPNTPTEDYMVRVIAPVGTVQGNLPPTAVIMAPSTGLTFAEGQPLSLRGIAGDDSGLIPDGRLLWDSRRVIAVGASTTAMQIAPPGQINLTAFDSAGLQDSMFVALSIKPSPTPTPVPATAVPAIIGLTVILTWLVIKKRRTATRSTS